MAANAGLVSMNTGSSNIKLCERTFARGRQRWRVDAGGNWSCYMWGWWPNGSDRPYGHYVMVKKDRVPQDLLDALMRDDNATEGH